MDYLNVDNIKRYPEVKVEEILNDGLNILSKDGNRINIKADNIIIAYGRVKVNKIYELYRRRVPSIYLVGDARMPRSIGEAIHAAGWAAREI
jgi:pyruvate/2-oxoglutarate dehydrogenase complex dihydrolipoamide dehydrogenase (E3) component